MSMVVVICLAVLAAAVAGAGFTPEVTEALRTSKNLYVATERADGSPSKVSPIWFMFDGEAVYFTTLPTSYKAKRVKRGRPLHVWVGSADGPHFVAAGEVLHDPALAERMAPAYDRKYWISWLGFFRPRPDRVRAGQTVIIRVRPPE
jgi:Pyridoxamine 5'-phosphate oxidase